MDYFSFMTILAISKPPKMHDNYQMLILLSLFVSIYLNIRYSFYSDKCLLINDVAITNYVNYNVYDWFLSVDQNIFRTYKSAFYIDRLNVLIRLYFIYYLSSLPSLFLSKFWNYVAYSHFQFWFRTFRLTYIQKTDSS